MSARDRITAQLTAAIHAGRWPYGAPLPATRTLADAIAVHPRIVDYSLATLTTQKLVGYDANLGRRTVRHHTPGPAPVTARLAHLCRTAHTAAGLAAARDCARQLRDILAWPPTGNPHQPDPHPRPGGAPTAPTGPALLLAGLLSGDIAVGVWAHGETLPPYDRLAALYGTPPDAVPDAAATLHAAGMVTSARGGWHRVHHPATAAGPVVAVEHIAGLLAVDRPDPAAQVAHRLHRRWQTAP